MLRLNSVSTVKWNFLLLLGAFAITGVFIWLIKPVMGYWKIFLILLPVVLLGIHHQKRIKNHWKIIICGIMLSLVVISSYSMFFIIRHDIQHPHEWDFLDFWIAGQCAAKGYNIYDPQDYQKIELPFDPSQEFKDEVMNVGLKYPPPSILIFYPLGHFEFKNALIIWNIVQASFFIMSVILIWYVFSIEKDILSILFLSMLYFSVKGINLTFMHSQTNFMALSLFLLFWIKRHTFKGGCFLALSLIVKPFLGIFLLFLLIKRSWKSILGVTATATLGTILSLSILGGKIFITYFNSNPSSRFPDFMYSETMNQSLLATIIRITKFQISDTSPMIHPIFIIMTLILVLLTMWVVYRSDLSKEDWAIGLMLLLTLLIYPSSMKSYSVFLIIPILIAWNNRKNIPWFHWGGVLSLIWIEFLLISVKNGNLIFFATFFLWVFIFTIGAWNLTITKLAANNV